MGEGPADPAEQCTQMSRVIRRGLTDGQAPDHVADTVKNGTVDALENTILVDLTHPVPVRELLVVHES
jgi:hypothetical protein